MDRKIKLRNIFTVILFLAFYAAFLVFSLIIPEQDYSLAERRILRKMPSAKVEDILSGKYMDSFDSYTLDQFPLRDFFRSIKAYTARNVLLQKDNHGLYLKDGYLSKIEYPANAEKINRAVNKLGSIYKDYLCNTECKTYLSIIPDKNYFLAQKNGYLSMDYPSVIDDIRTQMDFASYIDILPLLSLEDYYFTDQHWRQERIVSVAETIADKMAVPSLKDEDYITAVATSNFYGAYKGQSALKIAPEEIKYLTNETLQNCTVTSYNTGKAQPSFMYDMKKAQGRDAYEMFLSGSDALIVIENPSSTTQKQLVVFRDSFGSSLVPLLCSAYSKITLVDLRYIQSGLIKNYIDFTNQDVLFLYSTLVLNSSF